MHQSTATARARSFLCAITCLLASTGVTALEESRVGQESFATTRISVTIPSSVQLIGPDQVLLNTITRVNDIETELESRFESQIIREDICVRGDTNTGYYVIADTAGGADQRFTLRNETDKTLLFELQYRSDNTLETGIKLKPGRRSPLQLANRRNPQCASGNNAAFDLLFHEDQLRHLQAGTYVGTLQFTIINQ